MSRILIVVTSNDALGSTDKKTGVWLEEFTTPYYKMVECGAQCTVASPKGGATPIDAGSLTDDSQTESTRRYAKDDAAQATLAATVKLSSVSVDDFDGLFYPGGHGPLWDLATDATSLSLISAFLAAHKPVAAVCHGPAVLVNALLDGKPVVDGKNVTGFSNAEEDVVGLTSVVPFLLEDALKEKGGHYSKNEEGIFKPHCVTDGNLVTGQNPGSSELVADALLSLLKK